MVATLGSAKILIVPSAGIGDALIFQIAAHHLERAGAHVFLESPHNFGPFFPERAPLASYDAILLQHNNSERSKELHALPNTYTFFGSHKVEKHGSLVSSRHYVCDRSLPMTMNLARALQTLFGIEATTTTGVKPPFGVVHRKHRRQVLIHHTSREPEKTWPEGKFLKVADWLTQNGYEPRFMPHFPKLEEMMACIYEAGYFLGNDSGPGHAASLLGIPHLIIGESARHMALWQPGWLAGHAATPSPHLPRFLRKHWRSFISSKNVINSLKTNVLAD